MRSTSSFPPSNRRHLAAPRRQPHHIPPLRMGRYRTLRRGHPMPASVLQVLLEKQVVREPRAPFRRLQQVSRRLDLRVSAWAAALGRRWLRLGVLPSNHAFAIPGRRSSQALMGGKRCCPHPGSGKRPALMLRDYRRRWVRLVGNHPATEGREGSIRPRIRPSRLRRPVLGKQLLRAGFCCR